MVSESLQINPIWTTFGSDRHKALPAFHAFTGSNSSGRFARIGKVSWLNIYLKSDHSILSALPMLSQTSEVTKDQLSDLARFLCAAYLPKGVQIDNILKLRQYLFCKQITESDKLPPTFAAFKEHVLTAHVQARVWDQVDTAWQELLDPLLNGYYKDESGQLRPITTKSLPAPEAIIAMVRCKCKKDCTYNRCSCKLQALPCTELCHCGTDWQNDEDSQDIAFLSDSDNDSEDDDNIQTVQYIISYLT